ncbi:hypothetical protein KAR91_69510 [Candidatus Pacearchaeota archaeon]|nr:hypothetical protein [Candidatus Pacearchaeota archaeon]
MLSLIYNKIATATADLENASFPASNLLTDFKNEYWESTAFISKITLSVKVNNYDDVNVQALYLGNTNAHKADIVVKVAGSTVLSRTVYIGDYRIVTSPVTYTENQYIEDQLIVEGAGDVSLDPGVEIFFIDRINDDKQSFIDLIRVSADYTVEITLEASDVVYCGIARCGSRYDYKSPDYGLVESVVDNSIIVTLASGAIYTKERPSQRKFSGVLLLDEDRQYQFKSVFDIMAINAVPVKLHELNLRAVVFAKGTRTKVNIHNPTIHKVKFEILEQV